MSSGARQTAVVVAVALAGLALAVGLAVLTSRLSTQRIGLAGQPEGEGRGLVARPSTTNTTPPQKTTATTAPPRSRTTTVPTTTAPPAAPSTTTTLPPAAPPPTASPPSSGSDDSRRGAHGGTGHESDD